MDEATADLILALQLEDVEELKHELGSVEDEDTTSDIKAVLDLYREELKALAATITDRRYGLKLGEAESGSQPPSPVSSATPMFDDVLTKSFTQLTIEENLSSETDDSLIYQEAAVQSCAACGDEEPSSQVIAAPCGDFYCKPCIAELFVLAMEDESLFPPRCCKQPITLEVAGSALNEAQRENFEHKSIEFGTTDRTYCYNSTCSAFIPPAEIDGEKAACPQCEHLTCAVCKSSAHDGDCPKDLNYIALMEAAAAAGYQTCFQCKRLVELDIGCNHMTCLCRAQFCYLCGNLWKECACPQWDEGRLIARAQQVVDRAPPIAQAGAAVIPNRIRVQQVAAQLRDQHECEHEGRWRKVMQGDLRCEECFKTLPEYILQCSHCQLRACARCKRNRLR
ncbi:hypothetical protein P7C71_g2305, partial [Lecanoromycetidae sp. Uapishka_2]